MILDKLLDLREHLRFSGISGISRRYFVMNTFDGSLTMLGIIMGSYVYGIINVNSILGAGFGASLAMAMSGLSGAYMAERAERKRDLQELEKAMLRKLENSMHAKSITLASIYVAIVDGGAPLLAGAISLTPFLLAKWNLVSPYWAIYISIFLIMVMLSVLGIFLGRISEENLLISGIKTLIIGLVTAAVIFLVGGV